MSIKIGINGFGRIGKLVARAALADGGQKQAVWQAVPHETRRRNGWSTAQSCPCTPG